MVTLGRPARYTLEGSYKGEGYYRPASASTIVEVAGAGFARLLLLPIFLIPLGGGAGVYLYVRRRRTGRPPPVRVAAPAPVPVPGVEKAPPEGPSLALQLPQIQPPLPDVWGVGEELVIRCVLSEGEGAGLSGERVELSISGGPTIGLVTGEDGAVEHSYTFSEKGAYLISCSTPGGEGSRPLKAHRLLRVVDYREEVVGLYNSLLERARGRGLEIPREATPRDVQRIIGEGEGADPDALERVVALFEEAEYSLHPIGRRHYEEMYLAQARLLGGER